MAYGFYIGSDGNYHEGDALPGDTPVPQRPGTSYTWDAASGTWHYDAPISPALDDIDTGKTAAQILGV
jgi:hypothetical protein